MDKFIINGGKKLGGSVRISGAKNAILPARRWRSMQPMSASAKHLTNW